MTLAAPPPFEKSTAFSRWIEKLYRGVVQVTGGTITGDLAVTGVMAVGSMATIDSNKLLNIAETVTLTSGGAEAPALSFDVTVAGTVSARQPIGLKAKVTLTGSGTNAIVNGLLFDLNQSATGPAWNSGATIFHGVVTGRLLSEYRATPSNRMKKVAYFLATQASDSIEGDYPSEIYGLYVQDQSMAGVTTNYGIRIDGQTTATNNYGIWLNGNAATGNDVVFGTGKNARIYYDGTDLVFNTTTGIKLGTATTQKVGFWNATPVVQPATGGAASTFVANTSLIANDTATFDGYTLGQVVKALRNIGILA